MPCPRSLSVYRGATGSQYRGGHRDKKGVSHRLGRYPDHTSVLLCAPLAGALVDRWDRHQGAPCTRGPSSTFARLRGQRLEPLSPWTGTTSAADGDMRRRSAVARMDCEMDHTGHARLESGMGFALLIGYGTL